MSQNHAPVGQIMSAVQDNNQEPTDIAGPYLVVGGVEERVGPFS